MNYTKVPPLCGASLNRLTVLSRIPAGVVRSLSLLSGLSWDSLGPSPGASWCSSVEEHNDERTAWLCPASRSPSLPFPSDSLSHATHSFSFLPFFQIFSVLFTKWTGMRLFGIQWPAFLSQVSHLLMVSNGCPFRRCYKGYIYVDKQRKFGEKSPSPRSTGSAWLVSLLLRASCSWWAMFTLHWRWLSVFPRYTVALDRNNCIFRISF